MKINDNKGRLRINYLCRFLFLLITFAFFQTQLSWGQSVSLSDTRLTLRTAFTEIEKQTKMSVDYNREIIDVNKIVSIPRKSGSLADIMTALLRDTGCTYTVRENHIIITKAPVVAQPVRKTITGTIVDEQGDPIIGANVIEKGTINGTVTDVDGHFSFQADQDAILQISYIGYLPQEINSRGRTTVNVVLREDSRTLDEVVVIGYGTERRSLVTSAISKLAVDESNLRQTYSPTQLLDGRIAGVSVGSGSGNLGSGEKISVRGMASLNASNEPLYVIDGIPITDHNANLYNFGESMSALAGISLSDIESISILKDAASAAIYGSRATNGVVVITTKSGKQGRSDIRVNYTTGFSQFPYMRKLKVTDSETYLMQYNEGVDNYNKQYGLSVGDPNYKISLLTD